MRLLTFLLCTGFAVAKVVHVPYQAGVALAPDQSYVLHVDAAEPTEIGWRAVQSKPCRTNCVQITELRETGSYSVATSLGSAQKYRPVDGKISVEYKNVSSEPVVIDIFRIDRTCDAEACRFLNETEKPRSLVFLVDEFKSITTSQDESYSVIAGTVVSGRPFRIKVVWWTDDRNNHHIYCAPFVKGFLDRHTPKDQYRPYVIAGPGIGEGNNIVVKSIDSCAPKAAHYGASPESFYK